MSSSRNQTYVDLANKYMELRIAKKNDEILNTLVDDNIVIKSERDGIHTGKQAVKVYLNRIPPQGEWETAIQYQDNKAYIPGVVRAMWMDWAVFALFSFTDPPKDQPIKINKIFIKRGTIEN